MQLLAFAASVLVVVFCSNAANGLDIKPNDQKNPIILAKTGDKGRVEYVEAHIFPRHLTDKRTSFPAKLDKHFKEDLDAQPDDERGHVVASQFSGPTDSYNLVPQDKGLNRNVKSKWNTSDWFKMEFDVAKHIKDTKGSVIWIITPRYEDTKAKDRPSSFVYDVKFLDEHGKELKNKEIKGSQSNRASKGGL